MEMMMIVLKWVRNGCSRHPIFAHLPPPAPPFAYFLCIFDFYAQALLANGHNLYKQFPCFYIKPAPVLPRKRFLRVRKYLSMPFRRLVNLIDTVRL